MVYPSLSLNRLIATVVLFGLCLQGCRPDFQITSEGSARKKSRKTSDDEQVTDQFVISNVYDGGPLIAASVNDQSSLATSTVRVASPTRHLAVRPDVGPFWQQVLLTEPEETDSKPAARPAAVFGVRAWRQYFGEVGEEPLLPSDVDEILGSPCPFWPGKIVRDTHLLVLIPATVDDMSFNLNLLGELVRIPKERGYPTGCSHYPSDVQGQFGVQSPTRSYWVLMTRDVLEGSRSKSYVAQKTLVAAHAKRTGLPYELPGILEAATVILSHYVRSGERLYADDPWTYTRCQELVAWNNGSKCPVTVGGFSSGGLDVRSDCSAVGISSSHYRGISSLRKFTETGTNSTSRVTTQVATFSSSLDRLALLHASPFQVPTMAFGAREWRRYFGEVGEEPLLPSDIDEILDSPCPFWLGKMLRDTHLLVLIPATVDGAPFNLNLLGELVQRPQGGNYSTKYRVYDSDVREQFGAQSPGYSYWVMMTRDVLEGSRSKSYVAQKTLVAAHAKRTGLPYELPGILEAATVILSHYVRSGERLYADAPWTYMRCKELAVWNNGSKCPITVGCFSCGGLDVRSDGSSRSSLYRGVSSLREF